MKEIVCGICAALLFGAVGSTAVAGDAAAGKAKAALCAACHGPNGVSMQPIYPNLAGQKEAYLVKSLKGFKSSDKSDPGYRGDPVMRPMAAVLNDADIGNIAAYYASLKP